MKSIQTEQATGILQWYYNNEKHYHCFFLLAPSSGAVEISSLMTMDAGVAKSGLKMVSTLHSSTQANVFLEMNENEVVTAKVNMPKDKMEIVDVT